MEKSKARSGLAFALVAGGAFFVDRLSKQYFIARAVPGEVIPNIFGFTHHHNFGLMANVPVPMWLILLVTGAFTLVVTWAAWRAIAQAHFLESIALGFILAGALGNFVDRAVWGFVFDWILLFDRSIINIADAVITLGAVLFLIEISRRERN